ncbi:MAG TPA: SDR family NAD(P)-dependent oxidoreductase [Terriglobia bacterium]|nr:SDR family NAD(P)-dependent oxidoreductase [Terriglobia bacterium]
MRPLDGQVAIVTGAGRGIGRAIALELGRMGAKVVVAARNTAEVQEAAGAIEEALAIPTDVRSPSEVQRLINETISACGGVDVLVNAAGVGGFGPVVEFTDAAYDAIMDTNLRGVFLACRGALPSMIARGGGHIVNIASIAGKVGSANRAVYCASKFGVVGFSESLAEEVRQYGIRVAVICPGSTDSGFTNGRASTAQRERMLSPTDIAAAVRALVTQAPNSFISEIIIRPTRKP